MLISFVILPAHGFVALFAYYIPNNVSTSRHVALHSLGRLDVDHGGEQESFPMLAPEILGRNKLLARRLSKRAQQHRRILGKQEGTDSADYVVKIGQMGFAVLATKDLV